MNEQAGRSIPVELELRSRIAALTDRLAQVERAAAMALPDVTSLGIG